MSVFVKGRLSTGTACGKGSKYCPGHEAFNGPWLTNGPERPTLSHVGAHQDLSHLGLPWDGGDWNHAFESLCHILLCFSAFKKLKCFLFCFSEAWGR